ncbi:hypothetical protein AVEN_122773-1 [Araneus ventricosus]|uniref:Uncharacterized protein n=1 Tax=Araneus ventricosus TaxID=182803 RepID=A0A4Y2VS49_ARAVE|nr:hypothetical protein AVEN_122773-1 [Araneus ventricosus]
MRNYSVFKVLALDGGGIHFRSRLLTSGASAKRMISSLRPNTPAIHKTVATASTACVTAFSGVLWQQCLSGDLLSPREGLSLLLIFPPRKQETPFSKKHLYLHRRKESLKKVPLHSQTLVF